MAASDDSISSSYQEFLDKKSQSASAGGLAPVWMPSFLFDFQSHLVEWSLWRGRAATFADCGLGKTPMQLVWAENIVRHTNKPVLVLTPLAVGGQTVTEAEKFGIDAERSRDGATSGRARIVITNYEQLHHFAPEDFGGVVCDESSILKYFTGATQKQVTRFMVKVPYRGLFTATAAPNDYTELGTSSEALGELGYSDMLSRFFKQTDNKGSRIEDVKAARRERDARIRDANHYGKLAFRVSQQIGQWRLKGHAQEPFWQWVASWARACRRPSDLGFADARFVLPELVEREHIVIPRQPADGCLFVKPAIGLQEERDERRRTLTERIAMAASLVDHDQPAVVWCHMNAEGDALVQAIPGSVQIKGADSDERREAVYADFAAGRTRVLIIKPKIGAWGMNWQHCAHVVTFATHSYEQHYQAVRRCWRFGQTRPVVVDIISTEGEQRVRASLARKATAADAMFSDLVRHMGQALDAPRVARSASLIEVPSWIAS